MGAPKDIPGIPGSKITFETKELTFGAEVAKAIHVGISGVPQADMATQLAAARALVGDATARVVRGEHAAGLAAMAKNAATDMCSAVCAAAVQLHGGMGYMRGTLVERLARDARLYPIGGGTREIMNEIIAKTEGY